MLLYRTSYVTLHTYVNSNIRNAKPWSKYVHVQYVYQRCLLPVFVSSPEKRDGIVFQGWTIYMHGWGKVRKYRGKMSAKIRYIGMQHFNYCVVRNGELLSCWNSCFSLFYYTKTSYQIVIVKRKYIFEVQTPPYYEICTPMLFQADGSS